MINMKTASLAILLAMLATSANAQSIIQYSDSQGYGYRTEPLYPYAPPQRSRPPVEKRVSADTQPTRKVDPALIEELRKKRKPKATVDAAPSEEKALDKKKITRTIVVREKPVVRTNYRVVEHPPIVVQREVGEDQVAEGGAAHGAPQAPLGRRTIRAEAEITILGPDRMSIRLYRKQDGSDANARAAKPAPKPASRPPLKRSARADSTTKIR